ncbi:hypothetical protein [Isoptericola croceus]|uniref:hypothetical protein n=1 Tax=Isoptericola croceus TaxID=3031406 RepID=UPI0023F8CF74|nr:hypothetical protein [Isoptericola croceus]
MAHDDLGTTAHPGRRPALSRRRLGMVATAVALVALVVLVVRPAGFWPGILGSLSGAPSSIPSTEPVGEPGPVPVCGFPVLDAITQDGVDEAELDGVRTIVADVATVGDSEPVTFRIAAGSAFVLEREDATYTVTRYDLASGDRTATTTIELEADDDTQLFSTDYVEVDEAGDIFLLDTFAGRRDLLKVSADGTVDWRTALPQGPQTTGSVVDLYGVVRWEGAAGAEVVGVQDAGELLHRVTGDGELLEPLDLTGRVVGQLPDDRVVVASDESDGQVHRAGLRAVDAAGRTSLHLGASWPDDRPFAGSGVAWTEPSGVSTGPGDEGIVVAEPGVGFTWFGEDGVQRGVWPDSRLDQKQPFALWERTPLLRGGADPRAPYYVLARGEEGGFALTEITAERMAFQLTATKEYNATNEPVLGRLGLGAGLVVDRPHGVFPDGAEPDVRAVFDDTWAPWAEDYRLRYQVRGDPRVPDPVVGEETIVDLPPDGGEIVLDLPGTRPGVYEVDAALVRAGTGAAVSGTCLRYTVAAPGSPLDPATLADGADWGGAKPLRGVQLAEQLGIGSHRMQLDFSAIVPDPTEDPDPAALVWDSLPVVTDPSDDGGGDEAGDADPFAELAAAAELAAETDVLLIVQVGQGGEAEHAAAAAGTWEGWVRLIAAQVQARAPTLRHWQPWNEPNGTGYEDAARYEREVGAPFARAVRAAVPGAVVVGGNTLGIVPDWWGDLVAAGGCDSLDVVGIHPYTGFNRSWEEEGFSLDGAELDQLRDAIGPCGDVPVWDTESGWWSDGVANFRASAWDVARKLLWYAVEDVDEWTYFFSEGGFGEAGVSWSLLQYGGYLKPAGAVFAATAPFLDEFDGFTPVAVDGPGIHAVRADTADGVELLALWTEDLALPVRVGAGGGSAVRVDLRDAYGAERAMEIPAGGADIDLNGAPVFLVAPAGTGLEVAPVETFGPDVLEGRSASASSTHDDASPPAVVTSGTLAVRDPWRSGRLADGAVDEAPSVEVTTGGPVEIDRVAVATAGIRCCTSGLRDYTVSVRTPDGGWRDVAEVRDQFWERVALVRFDPVEVTAVRVRVPMTTERGVPVLATNQTGIVGGLHPHFIPLATESDWIAAVSAIQAWAPP